MSQDEPGAAPDQAAIVVDAMGGDHGPAEVVAGAAAAAAALQAPVILAGRPADLTPLLAAHHDVAGCSGWPRPRTPSPWTRGQWPAGATPGPAWPWPAR